MPGAPPFPATRDFSRGNESVTDLLFCVIWHDKHSADWLAALASPIRLPTPPKVETTHYDLCVAALLQIMFAVHPQGKAYPGFRGRIKHDSRSRVICSLTNRGGASHHPCSGQPRAKGAPNKTPQTTLFINGSMTVAKVIVPPLRAWKCVTSHQRGCISARRAVVGFYTNWRLL